MNEWMVEWMVSGWRWMDGWMELVWVSRSVGE